jgi:hypothetical protein
MKGIDKLTGWVKTISGPHHEVHEGKAYKAVLYNSNIGGETDDQIQLIWTTPGGPAQMNLDIHVYCEAAAAYLFTKGWTGGAASIDGTLVGRNRNHMFPDSSITFSYGATLVSGGTVPGRNRNHAFPQSSIVFSYGATVTTGGTVLETQTITTGKFAAGELRDSQEEILGVNTKYSVDIYLNGAGTAYIQLDWYMKTDRH